MATLGKPAIPTPGALELRSVQQAIDNIRERFAGLEAAVVLAGKTSTASQAAASSDVSRLVSSLRADLDALAAEVASTEDDLAPAPRSPAAPADDLAPAQRRAAPTDDDLAPAPISRAEFAALVGRVEAIEQE